MNYYHDLVKNDRLKKYEIHVGEFDVDIYTPFFSDLGIPAEDLIKLTRKVQGFTVLAPEALLEHYGLTEYKQRLKNILKETRGVPELDLSEHVFANLKKGVLREL